MRQYKLAELYKKCMENNCLNPSSEKEIMMVKVFAMDLSLRYKDINELLKEAETAYNNEQIAHKQAEIARERAAALNASEGILLFTAKDDKCSVKVYKRIDGMLYANLDNSKDKLYGVQVKAERGDLKRYTTQESKTVYTGATVGGVSMGGFHEVKGGIVYTDLKTDRGEIKLSFDGKTIVVKTVTIDEKYANFFKRDKTYIRYFSNNRTATCYNVAYDDKADMNLCAFAKDQALQMTIFSEIENKRKIEYTKCCEIANVLTRIINNDFPPSDEALYNQAVALFHGTTSKEIDEAVKIFNTISDYKDSAQLKIQAKETYDKVLWREKENKVITKENNAKKRKKNFTKFIITFSIVAVVSLLAIIITPKAIYNSAQTALNEKDFDKAYTLFNLLNEYDNSPEMLNETQYQKAFELRENNQFEESYKLFGVLEDYKDSRYQSDLSLYNLATYYKESGDTVKAIETLKEIGYASDDLKEKAVLEINQLMYEYVANHQDKNDPVTYRYVTSLMFNEQYRTDATKIYTDLFAWDFKVYFNNSASDTTTKKTSFAKNEKIFMHVEGSNDSLEKTTKLRCEVEGNDSGYSSNYSIYNDKTIEVTSGKTTYVGWGSGFKAPFSCKSFKIQLIDDLHRVVYETTITIN